MSEVVEFFAPLVGFCVVVIGGMLFVSWRMFWAAEAEDAAAGWVSMGGNTHRRKVEGGWLYRTRCGSHASTTFVPHGDE